jgi:hypothetical protein
VRGDFSNYFAAILVFVMQAAHSLYRTKPYRTMRLIAWLAWLPLLHLPLPIPHAHETVSSNGESPNRLYKHVLQFHHEHDDLEGGCHWHFVQLGDLNWIGMPSETRLPHVDIIPLEVATQRIATLLDPASCPLLAWHGFDDRPPIRWETSFGRHRWKDFGPNATARAYLVQLLCEQRC